MMPDYSPSLDKEEDYFPWDCDGQDGSLENFDFDDWTTGLGED